MSLYYSFVDSPLGSMWAVDNDGVLVGLGFGSQEDVQNFCEKRDFRQYDQKLSPLLQKLQAELCEYFEGRRKVFEVPVQESGTDFQKHAWKALKTIPFGYTRTYSEQAQLMGNPKACRAVGQANHHNPLSIIIPCHRVVGASGKLTGYASGLDRKQWLLDHERMFSAA